MKRKAKDRLWRLQQDVYKFLDDDRLMIALTAVVTLLVFAVFELVFGGGAGFGAIAVMWMLIIFLGAVVA